MGAKLKRVLVSKPLRYPLVSITNLLHEMTDSIPTVKRGRKRTIVPFTPLCLTFENITYSVDMPKVSL